MPTNLSHTEYVLHFQKILNCSLINHFDEIKDPRIERKKLHKLIDIIIIAICAVVSGADGFDAI